MWPGGQKARNLLCFHHGICYDQNGQPKSMEVRVPAETKDELLKKLNSAMAWPNPGDRHTTIDYTLLQSMDETSIQIYDAMGRLMEQHPLGKAYQGQVLIDTRKFPNGLFIFEITQNGKRVTDGKFMVTH